MADTPKVYVFCDANCKWEGMTKEQILTAIMQAVNEGTISNIDSGFVQTIKTITGTPLKFFVGTQYAYNALNEEEKENLFAIITDDGTKDGLINAIEQLQIETESLTKKVNAITGSGDGTQVEFALNAGNALLARTVTTQKTTATKHLPILLGDGGATATPQYQAGFGYNPKTKTLKADNIDGKAGLYVLELTAYIGSENIKLGTWYDIGTMPAIKTINDVMLVAMQYIYDPEWAIGIPPLLTKSQIASDGVTKEYYKVELQVTEDVLQFRVTATATENGTTYTYKDTSGELLGALTIRVYFK